MKKRNIIYCLILFCAFLGLYYPIIPDMYKIWMGDSDNSHGILVPFITLFITFKKRKEINWKEVKPSALGLIILLISLLFYITGSAGGIEILPRLTIVTTLIGLILYNLGNKIFYKLSFPVLFLIFMVPAPISIISSISLPLQHIVSEISAAIIESLSIPVFREGNMLYFSDASLEVAQACSGIRSLVSFLMLGFLFSYLMESSMRRKFIIVILTVPLAFLANLIRVTGTGILASFFGGDIARGFLHEFSGMVIFAFGFVVLSILYYILEKTGHKKDL